MKRGQRSPGSKACPKLKTLPLPVNSTEFRFAAPIASAAAASPVRCCAWPGAGSTTANPAASVQYIRIVGSSHEVISDRVLNREAISQVGSELRRRKTVRARIFSLVTVSHDLLWKQNLAPQ